MKISLAAVPYFWSAEVYRSFYQQVASSAVDIVYLGESVCSKRRSMKYEDWLEIAQQLTQAGKQVVLTTLTLLEAESELKYLTRISTQKEYLVEANDMAAIQVASKNKNPFVAGTAINVYNNQSLGILQKLGMSRWNIPVELGQHDLLPMISKAKEMEVETEYQIFGRMPLAYSARCFTARHYQLAKDDCQFKCLDDEQGILIKTQESDSFAQINGIQTQSAKVTNLLNRWQELKQADIDILRIVPVSANDTLLVIQQLQAMIGADESRELNEQDFSEAYEYCNGYWLQSEGMAYIPLEVA